MIRSWVLLVATSRFLNPVLCGGLRGAEGGVWYGRGAGVARPGWPEREGDQLPGQSHRSLQDAGVLLPASCGDEESRTAVSDRFAFCAYCCRVGRDVELLLPKRVRFEGGHDYISWFVFEVCWCLFV